MTNDGDSSSGENIILENPDKCESYRVERTISTRLSGSVYLARCIRGRLHGRVVAVKVLRGLTRLSEPNWQMERSLHHPGLVSLYSSFSLSDSRYLVMEFCDGGSLCRFIESNHGIPLHDTTNSPSLISEINLKPILRRIAEAVSFLHSQGTVHGDIRPHNVLLTIDGRAKLKAFGIPKGDSEYVEVTYHKAVCDPVNYTPPEASNDPRAGNHWDSWGYGCLLISCLTGSPPMKKGNPNYHATPSPCLPVIVRDLVSGLLDPNPISRLSMTDALSHPFLAVSEFPKPVTEDLLATISPKRSSSKASFCLSEQETCLISSLSEATLDDSINQIAGQLRGRAQAHGTSTKDSQDQETQISLGNDLSSIQTIWKQLGKRKGMKENQVPPLNGSPSVSYDSLSYGRPKLGRVKPLREVGNYSRSCAKGGGSYDTLNVSNNTEPMDPVERRHHHQSSWHPEPLPSASSNTFSKATTVVNSQHVSQSRVVQEIASKYDDLRCTSSGKLLDEGTLSTAPLRHDTRRIQLKRLNVSPLLPQTHKVAQGRIIITPSRHLVVELRESGERSGETLGEQSRHVLRMSADGQEINVYAIARLGAPTVLPEPEETWQLQDLPVKYWKSYKFARKHLELVKRRTPWMVWHTSQAKFTVMSNGPKGDIHATFPCPKHDSKELCNYKLRPSDDNIISDSNETPQMKLRYSRQQGTIDISCYTPSAEKKTKKGSWSSRSETLSEEELKLGDRFICKQKMTSEEQNGIRSLVQALQVVEAAELIYMEPESLI